MVIKGSGLTIGQVVYDCTYAIDEPNEFLEALERGIDFNNIVGDVVIRLKDGTLGTVDMDGGDTGQPQKSNGFRFLYITPVKVESNYATTKEEAWRAALDYDLAYHGRGLEAATVGLKKLNEVYGERKFG